MTEKPTLLIIDDEPTVRETFKLWLEKEGYMVYTASGKTDALKILEECSVEVCLVDLRLEEEDGLEISKELKKADTLLKILILTGFPSYETAIDAMKVGFFDYISKTEEDRSIIQKINRALEARNKEIAAKDEHSGYRKNIVLICNHMMIQEGFETFCRDESDYHLMHTYHSIDYIKNSDFNHKAALVLVCMTCNQKHLKHPKHAMTNLHLYFPNAAVLIMNSQYSDLEKMQLIKLGAKGFLPKNLSKEDIKMALQAVLKGEFWIPRELTHRLLAELLKKTSEIKYKKPENIYQLSRREIEILQAMASGLSNFEISTKLFISQKTVKAHIYHIFKKMDVKSRTQAIVKAVEAHII
ncbi:MAG: response regulator [Candidatus Aminicenantes bacterium]|jgi:DNA-binding NarL/FixJ family response regulator